MKVYVVTVDDVEATSIRAICATKEIAIKVIFQERDKLTKDYEEQIKYHKEHYPDDTDDMYEKMIESLSGNDWEKWDNGVHECPHLGECYVLDSIDENKIEEYNNRNKFNFII